MPGASLALFADLGACHVQKSSVTICVLPAPFRWRATAMQRINAWHNCLFLSTPSGWRATGSFTPSHSSTKNFYPRPPGGGRRATLEHEEFIRQISIHALRVEGDFSTADTFSTQYSISIHALRVEGDRALLTLENGVVLFLSTPSGWRATKRFFKKILIFFDFYPRPPGGGRQI